MFENKYNITINTNNMSVQSSLLPIYNCKLVLVGESGVGKTSIATTFCGETFNQFQDTTIGAAFQTQNVSLDDYTIHFEIWDTAGQERYHSLAPMYYRGAKTAIVTYDITSVISYERAKDWVNELQQSANTNIIIALAGNKCDLEDKRQINTDDAQQYANENELLFFETSAKKLINIKEIFLKIAENIPSDMFENQINKALSIDACKKTRKCCY